MCVLLKQKIFETLRDLKICSQTCCPFSRLSNFQNSYSFELRDSVFGSLPFSEFRRFGRLKRIRPETVSGASVSILNSYIYLLFMPAFSFLLSLLTSTSIIPNYLYYRSGLPNPKALTQVTSGVANVQKLHRRISRYRHSFGLISNMLQD